MRRFGINKKDPNPPWPNQQSVVVIPPGSNSAAVGMEETRTYEMRDENSAEPVQNGKNVKVAEDERGIRQDPIMGNMPQISTREHRNNMPVNSGNVYGNLGVSNYLCGQTGKYVKLEFLFGENTHMEKIGKLMEVGRDFIAIQENGTNNIIVCATNKIKFINIYEYGWQ